MKKVLLSVLLILTSVFAAHAEGERFAEFKRIYLNNQFDNDSVYVFLEQWAKDEPNNAEQLYCQGLIHYLQARPLIEYTEELKGFEKSAMLPACERFGKLQVTCFWNMQDKGNGMELYTKAHEFYLKALEAQPNNIELYSNLNEFYLWKYEHKYAASLALDMLNLHQADSTRWTDFYDNPIENTNAYVEEYMNELLGALIEKNESSLAELLCDTLLSRYPDNMIYRFDKGVIMINSFQTDKAIEYFMQMNTDFPNNGNILNALASLYSQKNDTENARKYATMLTELKESGWVMAGKKMLNSMENFTIDFEAVREWMEGHSDDYKALEKRFIEGDPSLNNLELSRIYFGHALTDQCKGNVLTEVDLKALAEAGEHEKCLTECRKILEQHPASIAALLYALMSASNIENEAEYAQNLYIRLHQLVDMIDKDAEDSMKKDEELGHELGKCYKILWRADENAFVELLSEEERGKTMIFSNPVYFITGNKQ